MTILNLVGRESVLGEWDTHEDYEHFYPSPELGKGPSEVPGRCNFRRYRFLSPFRYTITAVDGAPDVYRFEPLDTGAERRQWVEAMQMMIHDRVNDLLVGSSGYAYEYGNQEATGSYMVTVGLTEKGLPEYTFFLVPSDAPPFMIGHARV
jgi:hypothetical protein